MPDSTLKTLKGKKVNPAAKQLIVFDFDGTLVESKSYMDREMAALVRKLLSNKKVALIGGGKYPLLEELFLSRLHAPAPELRNLFLFPTTASLFYRYGRSGWKRVYANELSRAERKKIFVAFESVFEKLNYVHPAKVYGPVIEDRGTQVTFSALGQEIVARLGKKGVELKKKWTRENTPVKLKIAALVQKNLPGLEVRSAGYTSIDVTKKGIDKAYGIRQIEKHLKISRKKMLFVGDALFPGGNDYAALKTGVDCVRVKGPADTKKIIRAILGN